MKVTTKYWFDAAADDLLSTKKLATDIQLTGIAAFHCQQCLEKCFKGIIEEQNQKSIKSHDLLRLSNISEISFTEKETELLTIINEIYIDARYPGDMGLMPHGKPTVAEVENFINFSESVLKRLKQEINN